MATIIIDSTGIALEILSDAAFVQLPDVTDGNNRFTLAPIAGLSVLRNKAVPAADAQPGDLIWDGAAFQLRAGYFARKAVAERLLAPVAAASFAASLRGRAATLGKKGKTADAMALLLQAQRIDHNG